MRHSVSWSGASGRHSGSEPSSSPMIRIQRRHACGGLAIDTSHMRQLSRSQRGVPQHWHEVASTSREYRVASPGCIGVHGVDVSNSPARNGYHHAMATFDPTAPDGARWREAFASSLRSRALPTDTRSQLSMTPIGEAPAARMRLDAWWSDDGALRHASSETLVPLRRLTSTGWPGWPAYVVLIRLMRALG